MKVILVFAICSLVNVILSTIKSVLTVKASRGVAVASNAICYGFYTLVVKQLATVDYATALIITILANIVGVYISFILLDLFKKDRLWKIEVTVPIAQADRLVADCKNLGVGYNYVDIRKYYLFNFYCPTQADTIAVRKVLENYNAKYFITESKNF